MSEAELERHVRRITADLGLLAYHTRTSIGSQRGFPDWVIAGRPVLYRELKTQRGKLTAQQTQWLDTLVQCGQNVGIWRPEDLLSGRIARELAAIARDLTASAGWGVSA